jgi:hypothetical protein
VQGAARTLERDRSMEVARSSFNTPANYDVSTFFVLSVREERLPGRIEWRGELLHVDSGVTIIFEDWPDLVDRIASAMGEHTRKQG